MRNHIHESQLFARLLQELFPDREIPEIHGITIDSRKVQSQDLFLPLAGDHVNGHDFIENALENGASLCLTEHETGSDQVWKVSSVRHFLTQLAAEWRTRFSCPVIAITGSNGKTTTKELLAHTLRNARKLFVSPGNFNSTLGMPLSLFGMTQEDDFGIVELGSSSPGEIQSMCDILKPDWGLITNIQPVHIESFKSIDNIVAEKGSLFSALQADGTAFVFNDDPRIRALPLSSRSVSYGLQEPSDLNGELYECSHRFCIGIENVELEVPYGGMAMAGNALAVYSVARELHMEPEEIADRIKTFTPPGGRGMIIRKNGLTIVDDSYNANLFSALAGINSFIRLPDLERYILVLGDMFELGEMAEDHHRKLGEFIYTTPVKAVFGIGELTFGTLSVLKGSHIERFHFENLADLMQNLNKYCRPGDGIYIKGSRGMKLEKIVTEGFGS